MQKSPYDARMYVRAPAHTFDDCLCVAFFQMVTIELFVDVVFFILSMQLKWHYQQLVGYNSNDSNQNSNIG